jgi:hypothetical protein
MTSDIAAHVRVGFSSVGQMGTPRGRQGDCTSCGALLRVPSNASPEAKVRCPRCRSVFTASTFGVSQNGGRIFLSYSHSDERLAKSLAAYLEAQGYRVWMDNLLEGGQLWWDDILDHIESCELFVAAISSGYAVSSACRAECAYAVATNVPRLPVAVRADYNPAELPPQLMERQVIRYAGNGALWADAAFGETIRTALGERSERTRSVRPLAPTGSNRGSPWPWGEFAVLVIFGIFTIGVAAAITCARNWKVPARRRQVRLLAAFVGAYLGIGLVGALVSK